jgi:hypothetical protein
MVSTTHISTVPGPPGVRCAPTDGPDNEGNENPSSCLDHLKNMVPRSAHEKVNEKNGAAHTRVVAIEGEDRVVGIPRVQYFDVHERQTPHRLPLKKESRKERNRNGVPSGT